MQKLNTKLISAIRWSNSMRLVKFGLVGVWGFVVNMFFLWFLTDAVGLYYLLSSIVAIEVSLISNYVLNDLWTWRDRGKRGRKEYLKRMLQYHMATSAAMLVNLGLLWALTERAGFHYLTSNIFGILCGMALNFYFNDRWTFRFRKGK